VHFGEKSAASSFRFRERIAIAQTQEGLKDVAVHAMCSLACFHYRPLVDIVFWTCNILEPSGRKK